jgi:hypothetical protein
MCSSQIARIQGGDRILFHVIISLIVGSVLLEAEDQMHGHTHKHTHTHTQYQSTVPAAGGSPSAPSDLVIMVLAGTTNPTGHMPKPLHCYA